MEMNERMIHQMIVGKMGAGRKSIVFHEKDFNEKLAHPRAEIERFEIDGHKCVRMTYPV